MCAFCTSTRCAAKASILRSFLISRGDVASLEDSEGLASYSDLLGAPQDEDQLRVNLEWGKEKESFAILAAKRKLVQLSSENVCSEDQIQETGFTSCTAFRCVTRCLAPASVKSISRTHLLHMSRPVIWKSRSLRKRNCSPWAKKR